MRRIIAIGLSPNTQHGDIFQAIKQILMPWNYRCGFAVKKMEEWFNKYFAVSFAVSFSNARSALYVILKSMNIGRGDEVILQAFTCIVVPNAIIAVGATPVYADITDSLTLDIKDLEKKITKKTKAILVQHTFGISADMETIIKIAKKHTIFVIEDVAHTIGGEYKGRKLGTFGDASIFSLGRDKAFSSVFGGVVITNDKTLGEKIRKLQQTLPNPTNSWIMQQLFHPIAFSIILPLYNLGLGKLLLILLQRFHLLSFPVISEEKRGIFDPSTVKRYPHALAILALKQIEKLDAYNSKRIKISETYRHVCKDLKLHHVYSGNQPLLRFPVLVENPDKMKRYFRSQGNIFLGDWYAHVIDPRGSDCAAVSYQSGSCPHAETLAKRIVNLPTYPLMSDDDVDKVLDTLKRYLLLERMK